MSVYETRNLSFTDEVLSFKLVKKSKPISIPARNILSATIDQTNDALVIFKALVPKGKINLKLKTYSHKATDNEAAQTWINTINSAAYKDAKIAKRFRVFINPIGGSGKAEVIFNKLVEPIFDAAGCTWDITRTSGNQEHENYAKTIANKLDLEAYDAIVAVSGDGIVHEIINGLLTRNDALEIDIPIGVIPAGTGNALNICLLGNDYGISVPHATLNVIKGVPMKIDVCSVTQGDKRYFAFMSQNYGVLADGDIATDHLRWMKDFRFVYGTLQAILENRHYNCELAMKVVEDKVENIKQRYNNFYSSSSVTDIQDEHRTLVDKYGTVKDQRPSDWTVLENIDGYVFFASKVPWISKDNLVFPFALPSDGFLDLLVVGRDASKLKLADILTSFNDGSHVKEAKASYYKVEALRLTPINKENGYISIDGEKVNFEPFQVEVHPKLINIISMNGKYAPVKIT